VFGLAFLVGPGVGGLLITTVGASGALAGTGVTFLVAAASVVLLRGLPDSGRPARATRPDGLWSGTVEGLRFVLGDPLLRPLAVLVMLIVACYYPLEGIVLPVHFTEQSAPGQLSALLMAMSAGSILGTLAYERLLRLMSRRTLLVTSVLGALLSLVWLGMLPAFGPLMVAGALSGLLWGPVQPLLNHAMQLRTPHHMRGRVTGTITSASLAAGPVGLIAGGFLIEAYGVRTAALGLALGMLAVGVAMSPLRAWRLLDAAAVPGSAAADHPVGRAEPGDPRGPADGLLPAEGG
jgi:MFS family permease